MSYQASSPSWPRELTWGPSISLRENGIVTVPTSCLSKIYLYNNHKSYYINSMRAETKFILFHTELQFYVCSRHWIFIHWISIELSVYNLPGTFLIPEDTMVVLMKFTSLSRQTDNKKFANKYTFEFHILINAVLKIKLG